MIISREATTSRWLLLVGAGVVVLALAWISWQVLRLERRELQARHAASFQESLRLALWRMDSTMTPILAREAARPYFEYQSFYPANRAYTSMLDELDPGDVLVPSPLLTQDDDRIVMNYQYVAPSDGLAPSTPDLIRSPQVPTALMRTLATGAYLTPYALQSNEAKLARLRGLFSAQSDQKLVHAERTVATSDEKDRDADIVSQRAEDAPSESLGGRRPQATPPLLQDSEYAARQRAVQNIVKSRNADSAQSPVPPTSPARESDAKSEPEAAKASEPALDGVSPAPGASLPNPSDFPVVQQSDVEQGEFQPRWIGASPTDPGELVYERRIKVSGQEFVQGFLLDWPRLATELLTQVSDLFPEAKLEAVPLDAARSTQASDLGSTMLATIPAKLVVDVERDFVPVRWTPLRSALVVVWLVVGAAVLGLVLVVRAATQLAERRGRFVSAVTHELRTPLTTFRLYAQMLADGMVRDDEAKAQYARTLERESSRLATIVESVLEYARLGTARAPAAPSISVGALCDALTPVLESLARRGGLVPHIQFPTLAERDRTLRVHTPQVERIASNLVDNAVKYARVGDEPRLDIAWSVHGATLRLVVRDYGPGVPPADRDRIFRPFERGSVSEQGTIPGLGLGLALASDLARRQGGTLTLSGHAKGAEFTLELPLASA